MPIARDSQRSRLYAAERAAKVVVDRHDPRYRQIEKCAAYLQRIVRSKWMQKHHPATYGAKLAVGPGIGCRRAFARGFIEIQLPVWARSEGVMLHELAHIIINRRYWGSMYNFPAGHGREFAEVYVALVQRFLGREPAARLKAAFREHNVRFTPKRKVTMSPERRAALADRMRGLRAAQKRGG